jgi:transposase
VNATPLGPKQSRRSHSEFYGRPARAVGHSLLVISYHLIRRGTVYEDLDPNHFDTIDREAVQRRLVRHLEQLGYKVSLEPKVAA